MVNENKRSRLGAVRFRNQTQISTPAAAALPSPCVRLFTSLGEASAGSPPQDNRGGFGTPIALDGL
jgi:hypothetical protein